MYEIFEKLLDSKGITIYKFCKENEISESTIYTWKRKKSVARPDLVEKVCEYFGVSIDFLMGRIDMVACHTCGFGYNPLADGDRKEHDVFHERFMKAKDKFPFLVPYREADNLRSASISAFRSPERTFDEKIHLFDDYLKASFSLEISRSNYEYEHLNYEDFCKVEVGSLEPDWVISQELIDALIEKYGVDKEYLIGNEQLLARVSNNHQMMRLLKYLEMMSPETLNTLEIQVKALAEQDKKE